MSKNIITISQEDFQASIHKLSLGTIKDLIETIANFLQGNVADYTIKDLLRKETKLWKELQRRGYKIHEAEFINWRNSLKYNKRSF